MARQAEMLENSPPPPPITTAEMVQASYATPYRAPERNTLNVGEFSLYNIAKEQAQAQAALKKPTNFFTRLASQLNLN